MMAPVVRSARKRSSEQPSGVVKPELGPGAHRQIVVLQENARSQKHVRGDEDQGGRGKAAGPIAYRLGPSASTS
jgi:hypothetical protein